MPYFAWLFASFTVVVNLVFLHFSCRQPSNASKTNDGFPATSNRTRAPAQALYIMRWIQADNICSICLSLKQRKLVRAVPRPVDELLRPAAAAFKRQVSGLAFTFFHRPFLIRTISAWYCHVANSGIFKLRLSNILQRVVTDLAFPALSRPSSAVAAKPSNLAFYHLIVEMITAQVEDFVAFASSERKSIPISDASTPAL